MKEKDVSSKRADRKHMSEAEKETEKDNDLLRKRTK